MPHSHQPIRILAVDDDEADLQLLHRRLGAVESFEVDFHGFVHPKRAFQHVQAAEAFDVAILDYNIGRQNGLDVLAQLRLIAPDLPVIFLTGMRDESILIEMLRAGASDYMAKSQINAASIERAVSNAHQKGLLQRQIDSHAEQLEQTVTELRVREEEMRGFYHVLSHELKTPLTAMREFVSIVLEGLSGPITDQQREYLEIAQRNCDQMRTLMNDILDVTRMETGKLALEHVDVCVHDWLSETLQVHGDAAGSKGISLTFDVQNKMPLVQADEGRLSQVLNNLLSNAIKFTDAGGTIKVYGSLHPNDPTQIQVEVIDTGRGIEADRINYVFERLYQSRKDDFAIQGGLGLGLNISRGIIRSHGGELQVVSEPGKGSRFWFTIPIRSQHGSSSPNPLAA